MTTPRPRLASLLSAALLATSLGALPLAAETSQASAEQRSEATPEQPPANPAATPAQPAAPPVMPPTVVTPTGVVPGASPAPPRPVSSPAPPPKSVSLGTHGTIEVGGPPDPESRWHGFPISLSLRDAPLDEVLRSFARLAGVNLVLAPGVKGEVTVELEDVPWDQALYVILKTHGMGAEIDGRVWLVEPQR
jgi:hypothetical protein